MDCATRPTVNRNSRTLQQRSGAFRRSCAVRTFAFHEDRYAAKAAPAAPGIASSSSRTPLTPERIGTLPPAALAGSLLDFARQNALENTFSSPPANTAPSSSSTTDSDTTDGFHTVTRTAAHEEGLPGASSPSGEHQVYHAAAKHIAKHVHEFNAAALVDILDAFSRAGQGRAIRDMLAICCVVLCGQVDELSPTNLTRLAVALEALELQPTDLLTALCSRAGEPEVLPQFSAPELAALLEALSRLQHRAPPALFGDAADLLARELQLQLPGQSLGLPTGVQLQLVAGGPTAAAAADGVSGGRGLTPEQAVAAVWAMASAGLYHRPLFDGAGALLMDRLEELRPNSMARLAWAFATVRPADESHRGLWDRDLFDGIAWVGLDRGLAAYQPRELVTLLWSFASIPHYDGPLFDSIAARLAPAMSAGAVAPADLVATAWAVQRVGHGHVALMEALGGAALAAVRQLDGDDLTTIAMSFPAARAYSEGFFKHLVSEAQANPQFFGQVALLDIIRLISRVQHRDTQYYGAALQVLLDHVHNAFLDAPIDKAGCMNPFRFG